MTVFLSLITILKITYIILYEVGHNLVNNVDPDIMSGLELYIFNGNKDNDAGEYVRMFLPSSLLLLYSIVVHIFLKKPNPVSFKDIVENKPNQNLLMTMEVICWFSLVSV